MSKADELEEEIEDLEEDLEEADDDIQALYDLYEDLDSRISGMDRGQATFMRAMIMMLRDVVVALDERSSPEGRQAALTRIQTVVHALEPNLVPRKK